MKLYPRKEWENNMPKDLGASYCSLCKESEQEEYTIWQWKYWKIMHNKFPYLWLKKHIMAVPHEHITNSHEVSQEAYAELHEVHTFIKDFFRDDDYFSLTRESLTGRSLEHLHIHFIPWAIYANDIEAALDKKGL